MAVETEAAVRDWDELEKGDTESFVFSVSSSEMVQFAQFSGDTSRIHVDSTYARKNGFKEPVVYGAIIVSKLSYFVGMLLPGDLGLATDWQVNFHRPLYVDMEARFTGEITHLSPSTRNIRVKFRVEHADELIASGIAGSTLLKE